MNNGDIFRVFARTRHSHQFQRFLFQRILSNLVLPPLVFHRQNIVYVASNHFVWRLVPVSIATQIRQLLQDKQFELALQLAVSSTAAHLPLGGWNTSAATPDQGPCV